jgi:hypothetical protein
MHSRRRFLGAAVAAGALAASGDSAHAALSSLTAPAVQTDGLSRAGVRLLESVEAEIEGMHSRAFRDVAIDLNRLLLQNHSHLIDPEHAMVGRSMLLSEGKVINAYTHPLHARVDLNARERDGDALLAKVWPLIRSMVALEVADDILGDLHGYVRRAREPIVMLPHRPVLPMGPNALGQYRFKTCYGIAPAHLMGEVKQHCWGALA